MAADPWSSALTVYYDSKGEFFVWGLIDQVVHFNTILMHESESLFGPPPLGLCQVVATGPADLTVYRGFEFIARLAQESLQLRQVDIFSTGAIRNKLLSGFGNHLQRVMRSCGPPGAWKFEVPREWSLFDRDSSYDGDDALAEYIDTVSNVWFGTLCRLLIGIQRYRHGGALLISPSKSDLNIKYRIDYTRLRTAMVNAASWQVQADSADMGIWCDCIFEKQDVPPSFFKSWQHKQTRAALFGRELTGCIRFVASLSRVDGLVLATPNLAIRGFGVEIRSKREVQDVYLASTPDGRMLSSQRISANDFGTRHRSMMRYCFAHPESVGFVVSQDSDIRAMTRLKDRLVIWQNPKVQSLSKTFRREGLGVEDERGASQGRIITNASGVTQDDDIPF